MTHEELNALVGTLLTDWFRGYNTGDDTPAAFVVADEGRAVFVFQRGLDQPNLAVVVKTADVKVNG